jgi:DNA-binding SARP family transcriptional activator
MLRARLFGPFYISLEGGPPLDLRAQKPRELLAYLLLHPNRAHRREALASMLWGNTATAQSKKYLRQALWQVQTALRLEGQAPAVLLLNLDTVRVNPAAGVRTDVAEFEEACAAVRGVHGESFDVATLEVVQRAVGLYRGELLHGWYSDWLLSERDRLQEVYLGLLDKLLAYHAGRGNLDHGLACGATILKHDKARESSHRHLMRLYYAAGDRAAALRQYERCAGALARELAVDPSAATVTLYEQIRDEKKRTSAAPHLLPPLPSGAALPEILSHLQQVERLLDTLQEKVRQDIALLHRTLDEKPISPLGSMKVDRRHRAQGQRPHL